jgi:putative ABC transport system permease protein
MGLIVNFSIFAPPYLNIVGNDGLATCTRTGMLMALGECLKLNFYDWGVTALIAAAGAIAGTWSAGLLIYQAQFNLAYNPDTLWVTGMVIAMVAAVCLVGYLACRQSLRVSVRDLLA